MSTYEVEKMEYVTKTEQRLVYVGRATYLKVNTPIAYLNLTVKLKDEENNNGL